jgi:hypothetical protein
LVSVLEDLLEGLLVQLDHLLLIFEHLACLLTLLDDPILLECRLNEGLWRLQLRHLEIKVAAFWLRHLNLSYRLETLKQLLRLREEIKVRLFGGLHKFKIHRRLNLWHLVDLNSLFGNLINRVSDSLIHCVILITCHELVPSNLPLRPIL